MRVKCILSKNYNLTVGKEYSVVFRSEDFVSIRNDSGLLHRYHKSLFEDVVEEVAKEITEAPVPAVEVVEEPRQALPIATTINISFYYSGDMSTYVFKIGDKSVPMYMTNLAGNCGMKTLEGINELSSTVLSYASNDTISVEESFDIMMRRALDCMMDYINKHVSGAMLAFSTNDSYRKYGLWAILDEMASSSVPETQNPNSYMQIKTWFIDIVEIENDEDDEEEDY